MADMEMNKDKTPKSGLVGEASMRGNRIAWPKRMLKLTEVTATGFFNKQNANHSNDPERTYRRDLEVRNCIVNEVVLVIIL